MIGIHRIDPAFTDAQFLKATDKAAILRAWRLFLKSGCAREKFTKRLYYHLSQHCSFTAHYDASGFYDVYFRSPEGRMKFMGQFDPDGPGISVEYGDRGWLTMLDYADINEAMRQAARPHVAAMHQADIDTARARDLALADSLRAKWGEVTP